MSDALPEPRVALSGPDGRYALADLPAGSYTVSVDAQRIRAADARDGRSIAPAPIVVASRTAGRHRFRARPGRRHRRTHPRRRRHAVRRRGGRRARHALRERDRHALVRLDEPDRRSRRVPALRAGPGRYYVSAVGSGVPRREHAEGRSSAIRRPTIPASPFPDQARTVVVTGTGEPPRVEFRLKIVPPARVSGQLVASDGKQLFSAAIIMSPLEGEGAPMAPPEDPQPPARRHLQLRPRSSPVTTRSAPAARPKRPGRRCSPSTRSRSRATM